MQYKDRAIGKEAGRSSGRVASHVEEPELLSAGGGRALGSLSRGMCGIRVCSRKLTICSVAGCEEGGKDSGELKHSDVP